MAASLPPPNDPNALYILDLSGFVFRAYHALPPLANSKGEATHAVHGVIAMLERLFDSKKPAHVAVAVDPRGSSFRKEIYDEYKANRTKAPEDLHSQSLWVQEIVKAKGTPCISVPGFEADDVIASLVDLAKSEGLLAVVVSADKDLLQLVEDGKVIVYDPGKDKIYDTEATFEKMGVMPAQICDYLSLVGDSSDNIPGIPSVGPKTAIQLLADYGTMEGVLEHAEEIKKPALRQKVLDNKDKALLSKRLVALRHDVPLEVDPKDLAFGNPDIEKLETLYRDLEMHRALAALRKSEVYAASGFVPPPETPTVKPASPVLENQYDPRFSFPAKSRPHRVLESLESFGSYAERLAKGEKHAFWTLHEGHTLEGEPLGVAIAFDDEILYLPISSLRLDRPTLFDRETLRSVICGPAKNAPARFFHDAKRELLLWKTQAELDQVDTVNFDLMLASYLLDAEAGVHSLSGIASRNQHPEAKALSEIALDRGVKTKAQVPVEDLAKYAADRASFVFDASAFLASELERLGLGVLFRTMELPLVPVLARAEKKGVLLDVPYLQARSKIAEQEIAALEAQCRELAGPMPDGSLFNPHSPRMLEQVLFDQLGLPSTKKTKTARSTDAEVLEALADLHPLPKLILELRQAQKLKSTYLDALPSHVLATDGRVHTSFQQAVAATGRLSSSDPNLQNIPIRTEQGRAIRQAFVAEPGSQIFAVDYSQIELRVLAHASGDAILAGAFARGDDVHVTTAMAIFDVPKDQVTKDQRGRAKTVNFAVIYGQTEFALAKNLDVSQGEARKYIQAFFARYQGVTLYLESLAEEARKTGSVRTLFGRVRRVPNIAAKAAPIRWAAERIAKNMPVQGTAADVLKRAMITIDRELRAQELKTRMVLTVHDELVFEVPAGEEEKVSAMVRDAMQGAADFKVPLDVEGGFGNSWGNAKG